MTTQELSRIKDQVQAALDLLLEADQSACDLTNGGALDHKDASALLTYFRRATEPVRELITHLEQNTPQA